MFRTCGHSLELARIQRGSACVKVSNSDLEHVDFSEGKARSRCTPVYCPPSFLPFNV
jgi:hypothetical protein